jgi:iron complex outermembrane receptor protein
MKKILVGVPLILAPAAAVYAADSDSRMEKEQTMVVTAAPDSGLSPLTAPGAVSVDYGDDLRQARPQVNLSEGLSDVPGLQI